MPEERVGVVATFISFGRIVPAMMAVETRRGGAQCVVMCALRVGRAVGQMRVPTAEMNTQRGTAMERPERLCK